MGRGSQATPADRPGLLPTPVWQVQPEVLLLHAAANAPEASAGEVQAHGQGARARTRASAACSVRAGQGERPTAVRGRAPHHAVQEVPRGAKPGVRPRDATLRRHPLVVSPVARALPRAAVLVHGRSLRVLQVLRPGQLRMWRWWWTGSHCCFHHHRGSVARQPGLQQGHAQGGWPLLPVRPVRAAPTAAGTGGGHCDGRRRHGSHGVVHLLRPAPDSHLRGHLDPAPSVCARAWQGEAVGQRW